MTGNIYPAGAGGGPVYPGNSGSYAGIGLHRTDVPGVAGIPTLMASPPTVAASTTSGLTGLIVASDRRDAFTFTRRMAHKVTYPDSQYMWPMAAAGANNTDGAVVLPSFRVSFMTDAPTFELISKANQASVRILVNEQYTVAAGAQIYTHDNSGNLTYLSVPLGSRALRRIDVDYDSLGAFGGVRVGPTDTIFAAPASTKPRLLVLGDSFAGGTGASVAYRSFAWTLANLLGCVPLDSGAGGTGYLADNTGASVKARARYASDVVPEAPDIILFANGINDQASYAASAVGAEASALFAQSKAAFPNAQQFVAAPFWKGGAETMAAALLACRDAIKTSAAGAGFPFLDVLEAPLLTGQSLATTLVASSLAGASTVSTVARLASSSGTNGAGFTVEIGTGTANVERRIVTSWTGGGPFTLTPVGTMTYAHTSGEQVNLVGSSLWSGNGRVGTTAGVGNSDILVSSDGTHPSQAGHDALAYALYARMLPYLPA